MQIPSTSRIEGFIHRTRSLLLVLTLAGSGCADSLQEPPATTACRPFQFRACVTDAGRGSQQCAPSGREWGACSFIVPIDASYADYSVDVAPDADAADGGEPDADAGPADATADATEDAADAPEAG